MRTKPSFAICFTLALAACSPEDPTEPQDTDTGTSPAPPVAVIAADVSSGSLPLTVSFSGEQSEGDGLSYWWSFPDGSFATDVDVQRTWLGSGSYEVALQVTDTDGLVGTTSVDIEVVPADCPVSGTKEELGFVTDTALDEISGVGVSHSNPGVLWVHNDARNTRELYALDETGELLGVFDLDINYGDWEDIAVGVDADNDPVLYVGSVGNNDLDRDDLAILVISEPEVLLGERNDDDLDFHEMKLEFPGGPFDTESLMWDPQSGDLYLATKDQSGASTLFRAEAPHDEDEVVLEEVGFLDFGTEPLSGYETTAAAISPLGDLIAIRTYANTAYIWRRDASSPFMEAFDGDPCPVDLPNELQGESLDFGIDGRSLLTIAEGLGSAVNRTALE